MTTPAPFSRAATIASLIYCLGSIASLSPVSRIISPENDLPGFLGQLEVFSTSTTQPRVLNAMQQAAIVVDYSWFIDKQRVEPRPDLVRRRHDVTVELESRPGHRRWRFRAATAPARRPGDWSRTLEDSTAIATVGAGRGMTCFLERRRPRRCGAFREVCVAGSGVEQAVPEVGPPGVDISGVEARDEAAVGRQNDMARQRAGMQKSVEEWSLFARDIGPTAQSGHRVEEQARIAMVSAHAV